MATRWCSPDAHTRITPELTDPDGGETGVESWAWYKNLKAELRAGP